MESKIKFSTFATAVTVIINTALLIGCIMMFAEKPVFYTLLSIMVVLIVCGLFFAPLRIEADENNISVRSVLHRRRIPMRDVVSIELFRPTMGARRICGSGGYMGYWGIFSEGDIGRYFASYGKASDCFLVRLRNGDKYLLGCENPSAMVAFVSKFIAKQ